MPPVFTTSLAEHIAAHGARPCKEGESGEVIRAGMVYVAPGGYHMLVRPNGTEKIIELTQTPPINSCRPSADPMFSSISHSYGTHVLAIVLTGIGRDGAEGARTIEANGGSVIAQDRETSAVYGMPKSVAEMGVCEAILSINAMADYILERCA